MTWTPPQGGLKPEDIAAQFFYLVRFQYRESSGIKVVDSPAAVVTLTFQGEESELHSQHVCLFKQFVSCQTWIKHRSRDSSDTPEACKHIINSRDCSCFLPTCFSPAKCNP